MNRCHLLLSILCAIPMTFAATGLGDKPLPDTRPTTNPAPVTVAKADSTVELFARAGDPAAASRSFTVLVPGSNPVTLAFRAGDLTLSDAAGNTVVIDRRNVVVTRPRRNCRPRFRPTSC